jgi:hypothetical protein
MITIVRCYPTLLDANKRYLCWKPLCHKHLRLQTIVNSPTETQCVLARVTNLRALFVNSNLIFLSRTNADNQQRDATSLNLNPAVRKANGLRHRGVCATNGHLVTRR